MGEEHPDEEAIFQAAIQIESPSERAAYLDRACGDDGELRAAVDALLQARQEAGNFLDTPAIEKEILSKGGPLAEGPGTVIGRYKLLEKIGEGGFGVVYMAQQTEPIRCKVALKIIKLGMDTKQVIARFEAERQALAMMDHPNIAKVLDAGSTDSGRPYFVMELVRGIPITEYCDKNSLPTQQRLELFTDVCHALQHAHQKGIIHRDVKPTNVLVTLHDGTPVPKVIDFGIAKALGRPLTDKTLFTEFRQFVGTPEYMSPEQAQLGGLDIDTRCDIYALGVLLYELLTGTTPFDPTQLRSAGYDEILRIIRETDPPKPSTRVSALGETLTEVATHRRVEPDALGRLLRGDLDWIVMRALEKDRARRYETANALALDVQRHLDDQPVRAGPPSVGYRARKFVRRHRRAVAAGAVVAAAVAVGAITSTVGFVRASREAVRATAAEQDAIKRHRQGKRLLARAQLDRGVRLLNEGNHLGLLDLLDARITADEVPGLRDSAGRLWAIAYARWAGCLVHVMPPSMVMAFSPDGRLLATADGKTAQLWNLATGKPVGRPLNFEGTGAMPALAFSPDGKLLATTMLGASRLWHTATGEPVGPVLGRQCATPMPQAHRADAAAFNPDGTLLAAGSPDGTVQLWQTATGKPHAKTLPHGAEVVSVAFSPDGRLLAGGSLDGAARLWHVASGQPNGPPLEHLRAGGVIKAAFSPNGKLLATEAGGEVALWKAQSGQLHKRLEDPGGGTMWITDPAFSPDGKLLATGSYAWTAQLWNTATGAAHGKPLRHNAAVLTVAFSPDGRRLVTGSVDKTVRLWDVATGLPCGQPLHHQAQAAGALGPDGRELPARGFQAEGAFSPDGELLATRAWNMTTRIWKIQPTFDTRELPHRGPLNAVAFSPDGKYLATASGPTVRLWDVATGQPWRHRLEHGSRVTSLAFSPDAKVLVTGSWDRLARLWDVATGELLGRQFRHHDTIRAIALSPDGKLLATASQAPMSETIRLWDVASGQEFRPPSEPVVRGGVRSLAFSPDGKLLASGSSNVNAYLWEVATGRLYYRLLPGFTAGLAFRPDGNWLATA